MQPPVLLRVALERAGAGENGFPELFNSPPLGELREDLFGPLGAGHGVDAPLLAILAGVDVGAELDIPCLHSGGVLGLIDSGETVRVLAENDYAGGKIVGLPLLPCFLPGLDLAEPLCALVADV